MEALRFSRVLDGALLEEKHAEVDVGVEVDVHCQFESLNRMLLDGFTEANGMIINQDVNRSMVLRDLRPHLLRPLNIRKVSLVEVHVLEVTVAGQRLDVLHELSFEVATNVNDYKVHASKLTSANELLCKKFAKTLRATCDHDIRAAFWGKVLLDCH